MYASPKQASKPIRLGSVRGTCKEGSGALSVLGSFLTRRSVANPSGFARCLAWGPNAEQSNADHGETMPPRKASSNPLYGAPPVAALTEPRRCPLSPSSAPALAVVAPPPGSQPDRSAKRIPPLQAASDSAVRTPSTISPRNPAQQTSYQEERAGIGQRPRRAYQPAKKPEPTTRRIQ
jgi:hypothetical protein